MVGSAAAFGPVQKPAEAEGYGRLRLALIIRSIRPQRATVFAVQCTVFLALRVHNAAAMFLCAGVGRVEVGGAGLDHSRPAAGTDAAP